MTEILNVLSALFDSIFNQCGLLSTVLIVVVCVLCAAILVLWNRTNALTGSMATGMNEVLKTLLTVISSNTEVLTMLEIRLRSKKDSDDA